jgi:hypothetical protein
LAGFLRYTVLLLLINIPLQRSIKQGFQKNCMYGSQLAPDLASLYRKLKNAIMITQYQVSSLIREEIPQLALNNCPTKASLRIYTSLNDLTDYTKHAVQDHNLNVARKCFTLAGRLYREGDRLVRFLIENIFVHAFSSILPEDHVEYLIVKSFIPETLFGIYLKQVMSSGC